MGRTLFFILLAAAAFGLVAVTPLYAQTPKVDYTVGLRSDAQALNKLGTTDASLIIGRVAKVLVGIMGSIALLMFVYGGVVFMSAGGNQERSARARGILVWSALGVIILLASYAIISFIFAVF